MLLVLLSRLCKFFDKASYLKSCIVQKKEIFHTLPIFLSHAHSHAVCMEYGSSIQMHCSQVPRHLIPVQNTFKNLGFIPSLESTYVFSHINYWFDLMKQLFLIV